MDIKKFNKELKEASVTSQKARQGFYQGGTWRSTSQTRRQQVMAGKKKSGESESEHDLRSIEELEQAVEKAINFILAPVSYNSDISTQVSSKLRMFKNRMDQYIKSQKDQLQKQIKKEQEEKEK